MFFHLAFSLGTRTLKISVGTFVSDLRIHHLNYLCIRTNEPWPLIEPRTVWLVLVILVVQCEYIYGGNRITRFVCIQYKDLLKWTRYVNKTILLKTVHGSPMLFKDVNIGMRSATAKLAGCGSVSPSCVHVARPCLLPLLVFFYENSDRCLVGAGTACGVRLPGSNMESWSTLAFD